MQPEENNSTRKYFKIGDVSKMLEVPASTLRFWEKEFKQIKPMKNKKGDRIYNLKDIEILKNIKFLTHEKGLKIAKATGKVSKISGDNSTNAELVKRLRELKEMLLRLKESM